MDQFVFREYEAYAISNLKDLSWTREAPNPPTTSSARRHEPRHARKGPRSLFSLALETAAENIEDFDDDYLASLPKREWIQSMWKYLDFKKGQLSFEVWKKFNRHLPRDGNERTQLLKRFHMCISVPTAASFAVYTQPLQATAGFDFITHLRIAGSCQITARDLMLLPGLSTLGVLEIVEPWDSGQPFPRVDDRMIKAWSSHDTPFPRLLILKVSSIDSFTEESMRYLHKFSQLAMFEVFARRKHWRRSGADNLDEYWARCDASDLRRSSPYAFLPLQRSTILPDTTDSHKSITRYIANNPYVKAGDEKSLWGCWTYTTVERMLMNAAIAATNKTNKTSQRGGASATASYPIVNSSWNPYDCEPTLPFASLALGSDRSVIEAPVGGQVPGMARIIYYRRSMIPGADAPQAVSRPTGRSEVPSGKKAARKSSDSNAPPLKRRRVGAIQDVLGDFQR